jgi:hypothetical protein
MESPDGCKSARVTIAEVQEDHSQVIDVMVTIQWTDRNDMDRSVAVNGAFEKKP